MGNRRHPYDVSIEDFAFLRREMERDFIEDDGVICAAEQGILVKFDDALNRIRVGRGFERGFELLMKQEGKPSRYTHDMFEELGVHIEPLDAA